MKDSLYQENS